MQRRMHNVESRILDDQSIDERKFKVHAMADIKFDGATVGV